MADFQDLVDDLERSYTETQERLSDPAVYNDHREAADVGRRLKELEGPHKLAQEWRLVSDDLEAARDDGDLRELVPELEERRASLEEELKLELDPNELKIDVYRSTGPGGQSVNTTDSAVRITHVPTGIVVAMQDEKSQLQNKTKAMRVLRARLYELERERQQAEQAAARRSQIGSGQRAEKLRTYNFPAHPLTDHRVHLTVHRLDKILEGELDDFTEALAAEDRRRALETASA